MLEKLKNNDIEFRPIVTGDFTKSESLKFFDYELSGNMDNAELLDYNGFFVGNSHEDLTSEIYFLRDALK